MVHLWGVFQAYNTTSKPMELDFTEMGYSSVKPSGCASCTPDEATQAAYLSLLEMESQDLKTKGIPLNSANWYDFMNDHDPSLDSTPNVQHNCGLQNFGLTSGKAAFTTYKNIISGLPNNNDIVAAPSSVVVTIATNPTAASYRKWSKASDGSVVIPFWRLDQVTSVTDDFTSGISVTLPAGMTIAGVTVRQTCGSFLHPAFTQTGTTVTFSATVGKCASWATLK